MNDDSCFCDTGDGPDFYSREVRTRSPRATKPLKCYECHYSIRPGDRYERVWAKWPDDDAPRAVPTCPRCLALREYVEAHVPCFCWEHGNMLDAARDTVEDYAWEAPGLLFGFLRLLIAVEGRRRPPRAGPRCATAPHAP
jgi:hypothetical protein